jgi:two-component system sensor histidine kinase MtrB
MSRPRRKRDPQPSFEDMAASLAHHIRTPLATTLLYLHLIESELGANVTQTLKDGLEGARGEMERLDQLLGKLLDHHRLGRVPLQPIHVDAGRIVTDVVARTASPGDPIGVEIDAPAEELVDWWDAGALEQILQNLLTNALQHGGPPVSVTVARIDGGLRLRVRDGGTGVPARAFVESFRRRTASSTRRKPGLGVGLWLVGELAHAHGGTTRVEIDREGGTVVTVTLHPTPTDWAATPAARKATG